METFLKAALQAWNPIGETRRRLHEQTLTVPEVLVPTLTAIIAFNLFAMAGYNFFLDALGHAVGQKVPGMNTQFITQLVSMVGAAVPLLAISLLPRDIFRPFGRSAVAAAFLLIASAIAFYGASLQAIGYFVAGATAWDNWRAGVETLVVVNGLVSTVELALMLYLWTHIGRTVLRLATGQVMVITVTAILSLAVLGGLVLMGSMLSAA